MLKIDQRMYSPAVIEKIVFAAGTACSAAKASKALQKLAGLKVCPVQALRITHQIGDELRQQRESDAQAHKRRELKSNNKQPVDIACVEVDGGRTRTRAHEQGRGVHAPGWKESKVAAVWRMSGPTFEADPHPEPYPCLLDRDQVPKLATEMKRQRKAHRVEEGDPQGAGNTEKNSVKRDDDLDFEQASQALEGLATDVLAGQSAERLWPPKRIFRTCVATMKNVHEFGPLVAAEAQKRGFFGAARQVFLGDGDHNNWRVHKIHFPHFTAITDFIHVMSYLYETAGAVTDSEAAQWEQYEQWVRQAWQGEVALVIAELSVWQARFGLPDKATDESDPKRIVSKTVTYLTNNAARMNYQKYRQAGLPITSSLVESLIKEINHRLKGTDKYWNRLPSKEGAESMLQVTATLLSDRDELNDFVQSRPGSMFYRRTPPTPK